MSNPPPPMGRFLFPQDDFSYSASYSHQFLAYKDNRTLAKSCKIDRVSHFKDFNRELFLIEVVYSSNSNKIKTFLQIELSSLPSSLESLFSGVVRTDPIIFIP